MLAMIDRPVKSSILRLYGVRRDQADIERSVVIGSRCEQQPKKPLRIRTIEGETTTPLALERRLGEDVHRVRKTAPSRSPARRRAPRERRRPLVPRMASTIRSRLLLSLMTERARR